MVWSRSESVMSPQVKPRSRIYFLYLCCKVSFIPPSPPPQWSKNFCPLFLPPSYIKSRGTDSSLHPPSPMEIWCSSINLNEFVHDLHWCNWSKSGPAIRTAVPMATGSRFGSINHQAEGMFSVERGDSCIQFSAMGWECRLYLECKSRTLFLTTNEPLGKLPPTALVFLPVKWG